MLPADDGCGLPALFHRNRRHCSGRRRCRSHDPAAATGCRHRPGQTRTCADSTARCRLGRRPGSGSSPYAAQPRCRGRVWQENLLTGHCGLRRLTSFGRAAGIHCVVAKDAYVGHQAAAFNLVTRPRDAGQAGHAGACPQREGTGVCEHVHKESRVLRAYAGASPQLIVAQRFHVISVRNCPYGAALVSTQARRAVWPRTLHRTVGTALPLFQSAHTLTTVAISRAKRGDRRGPSRPRRPAPR